MDDQLHTPGPRHIVVLGGGIGGAEAALTLAAGLQDAQVTLVGRWPSIRILPDLVYVPFGVSPRRIDLPLSSLMPHGVRGVVADVERVDVGHRVLHTSAGPLHFDVLVAAPGAMSTAGEHGMRTLDDAMRVRGELERVMADASAGEHRSITIRCQSDDSWTAPACELALLLGGWIRAARLEDRIETLVATSDREVFEWFGPLGEATVEAAMRRARVKVATDVPAGRFDELGGDLVIDFGQLAPRRINGLPGIGPTGWYEPSATFEVAPDIYVIGDAINLPYRAGFATAWHARSVLRSLGGDTARLGLQLDGIPNDAVEYQMDLADGVLRARIPSARVLGHPFLGHDADVEVSIGARPDKLAGLLLHERILQWDPMTFDAPLAYRDALRRQVAA
jgi:hypothetical protein